MYNEKSKLRTLRYYHAHPEVREKWIARQMENYNPILRSYNNYIKGCNSQVYYNESHYWKNRPFAFFPLETTFTEDEKMFAININNAII